MQKIVIDLWATFVAEKFWADVVDRFSMKVLHIISGDLWAGAEVMAFNLLKGLKVSSSLDLSVGLLNEGRLAEMLRRCGMPVRVFDEQNTPFPVLVAALRNHTRDFAPRIIHTHRYKENILAFLCTVGSNTSRLIATQHGMPENVARRCWNGAILVDVLNRYVLTRRYERVVAVSRDIAERFAGQQGFPEGKLNVIHNGIDLPAVRGLRNGATGIVIGSAGRLFPVKDYSLMVSIAQHVTQNDISVQFELAGDGPERGRLENLAAGFGLSARFRFWGHLQEMERFYRGLDIYLNTSVHEGIPMSILEAMALGIPIIAPRVGGIVEIITDGVEGFLVASRNPKEFAEKCLILKDETVRRRMGLAARKRIEGAFSSAHMAGQYLRLYQALDRGMS